MAILCAALLLIIALLASLAARAKPIVVRASWKKARAMLTYGEFRSRIAVDLKVPQRVMVTVQSEYPPMTEIELNTPRRVKMTPGTADYREPAVVQLKPSKWINGEFIVATDAGLKVGYRNDEFSFERQNISRIRLVPRSKSRWTGLLLGIPAGFGAGLFTAIVASGGDLDRWGGTQDVVFFTTLIVVPYVFHRLWGGDRGAVLVVLDESTTK